MVFDDVPVSPDDFHDFMWYAVDHLDPGTNYEFLLLGSGSLILAGENAMPSTDFDMLSFTDDNRLPEDFKQLSREYGHARGYGYDWISDDVIVYETTDSYMSEGYREEGVLEFANDERQTKITIILPAQETVVYKKLLLNRDKDWNTAISWLANHGYRDTKSIERFLLDMNPGFFSLRDSDYIMKRIVKTVKRQIGWWK